MIRLCGGDAVGMSTVHEVIAARHMNMRVLAMSGITNVAIDHVDGTLDTNHEHVLEAGALLVPRMTAVLRGVLRGMAVQGE
jgi:purine-nucleoside phosphorylase